MKQSFRIGALVLALQLSVIGCGTSSDDGVASGDVTTMEPGTCRPAHAGDGPSVSYWYEEGALAWERAADLIIESSDDNGTVISVLEPEAMTADQPRESLRTGEAVVEDLQLVQGQQSRAVAYYLVGYLVSGTLGPETKAVIAVFPDGSIQGLGNCAEVESDWLGQLAQTIDVTPTEMAELVVSSPQDPRVQSARAAVESGPERPSWESREPAQRVIDPDQTPSSVMESLDGFTIMVEHDGSALEGGFICSRSSIAWGQECTEIEPGRASAAQILVHAPVGESAEVLWSDSPDPNLDADIVFTAAPPDALRLLVSNEGLVARRCDDIGVRRRVAG